MEKTDLRKVTSEVKEDLRKRAIRLLNTGKSQSEVAELFGIHVNTVNNWNLRYKKEGNQGFFACI